MRQTFPGIHLSTVHDGGPGKSDAHAVDGTESGQNSAPMAIAGSEVFVASTSNHGGESCGFFAIVATGGCRY